MLRRAVLGALLAPFLGRAQEDDELLRRWNEFATISNEWAQKERSGVFDYALAKKMSIAFRRVENCGEWPKP